MKTKSFKLRSQFESWGVVVKQNQVFVSRRKIYKSPFPKLLGIESNSHEHI